jgi:hypothetical protein
VGSIAAWIKRAPFTLGYAVLLLVTGVWLSVASLQRVAHFEQFVSTNLDNLGSRPVQVLLLSLSATDASYRWLFLTLVVLALGACESWLGTWRTLAVYVGSNIVVTLLVAAWIEHCVSNGTYDVGIRATSDFGVSYGLNTLLMLLVARPPTLWQNAALAVLAFGWLCLQDPWGFTDQAQFFGLGHILAAVIGLALAVGVLVRRELVRRRLTSQLRVPDAVAA